MIYRTWFCLNRNCRHEWTIEDADHPPCPLCAGTRVQWIPRTVGVMSSKTQNIDATVKELKAAYGDKPWRSPVAGEAVAPRPQIPVVPGRTRKFAPAAGQGWALDLPTDQDGKLYDTCYCGPTGVTAKAKATVGSKVALDPRSPTTTGATPLFHGVHRP